MGLHSLIFEVLHVDRQTHIAKLGSYSGIIFSRVLKRNWEFGYRYEKHNTTKIRCLSVSCPGHDRQNHLKACKLLGWHVCFVNNTACRIDNTENPVLVRSNRGTQFQCKKSDIVKGIITQNLILNKSGTVSKGTLFCNTPFFLHFRSKTKKLAAISFFLNISLGITETQSVYTQY
jgi:hypothetical protein